MMIGYYEYANKTNDGRFQLLPEVRPHKAQLTLLLLVVIDHAREPVREEGHVTAAVATVVYRLPVCQPKAYALSKRWLCVAGGREGKVVSCEIGRGGVLVSNPPPQINITPQHWYYC